MKKISLPLALLLMICFEFSSCKKKKSEPDPTPTPTPAATVYHGIFSSEMFAICNGTIVNASGTGNYAYVSNQSLYNNNPVANSLVDVGNISMNAIIFKKNSLSTNRYSDTTTNNFSNAQVWNLSGSGQVSAFTYTNAQSYPAYTGYVSLADSFQISGGITIPLSSYTNVDEIQAFIYKSSTQQTTIKYLSGTPSNVQFTSSELNSVGIGTGVSLYLIFYKNNVQTIGGNTYTFRTGYYFIKSGIKFK